jgi:D-alanyl-D-alanine carboxypeptidase/D-alanyl-D-alanine-endopeptidase (penicillin-binding protein 4)
VRCGHLALGLIASLFLLLLLLLAGTSATATATERAGPSAIAGKLDKALASPGIDPRRAAAFAVDLRTGEVVFQRRSRLSLAPASAEKLAVAFGALRLLGSRYRFRTEVRGSGDVVGGTWKGDLYLVGQGDPTLRVRDLDALARKLRAAGIRRVAGSVVGDEQRFDGRRGAPGWKPSFVGIESPPLSALSVEGVPVRTLHGSAPAAAAAFTAALERNGIAVAGLPRVAPSPAGLVRLALDLSAPLSSIVVRMNRTSDNFISEMILKELGAAVVGRGSTAAGAAVVRGALDEAGVPLEGVRVVDGSGLSVLDRMTVKSLVVILRAAESDPDQRDVFLASLPVSGVSGTLRRRLDGRLTRGKIAAKTGTTSQASALAGFVKRRYVFAILQNGSPVPYWYAREAQDRFVTVLARS